ncbi:helix-turn-helix transcriptional regulator [Psychromicrobium xiongbiense]|uniref:helix-turn-helix transcriptional regulator n=1 Tax=Psychromicrobium xiongbiense TaxID=3051184 RepID=UPI002556E5C7|nr:WYL domain-containing protein [Psychromicrobium sp. YIM S02556]
MSASRTERLLNVLIALLETKYGRSKEFLRQNIQAYRESTSTEAFERMFERDKTDLRALGIPLESHTEYGVFEDDPATTTYRIPQEEYRLPQLQFSVEEAAVLALAARLWERAALGSAAARAVRKIETQGALPLDEGEGLAEPLLEPRITTREPAFEDLLAAVAQRQPVVFQYQGAADPQPRPRHLEPWGLGQKFGHWYVVGHDVDRDAQRMFRLSRIAGGVSVLPGRTFERPPGFSVADVLQRMDRPPQHLARVAVRPGRAQALRTRAQELGTVELSGASWDLLELAYSSALSVASELAGWGPQVRVIEPESVTTAVRARLQATLDSLDEPLPDLQVATDVKAARRPKTTAQDHVRRLVDLVPYLVHHPGVHVEELAKEFRISRSQVEADLSLLMVSGLPGGLHGDLMDVTWDDGRVFIADAEELSEAVRFSLDEAAALLVGLEALGTLPDVADDSAVRTAMSKISAAAGEAAGLLSGAVSVQWEPPRNAELLPVLHEAIRTGTALQLRYLVPHRDEVTERVVDPQRVFSQNDAWYIQAWCHSAEAERMFRVDRILSAAPVHSSPEPVAVRTSFPERIFASQASDVEVSVLLEPSAKWVVDYYEADRVQELPEGGRWSTLAWFRVGSTTWLPQLLAQSGGAIRLLEPASDVEVARAWCEAALAGYR